MRLALTFILFAATMLFHAGISQADEKPNFSGTWKAEADQPTTPRRPLPTLAGLGSGWGVNFTISQTLDLVEVERPVFVRNDLQPQPKFRYSLTGDERTNTVLMGRGAYSEVSTARWKGDKLLITTIQSFRHPDYGEKVTYEIKHVLSLEQPNTDPLALVIETTRAGAFGGTASNTRTVFHKE